MSLLSAVEGAIKACKAEQANINDSIQLYRGLLQSIRTLQPKMGSEKSESAVDAAADTSPGEREDIELLERVLEKALRVRTGTAPSKKDTNKPSAPQKESHSTNGTSKEVMQVCAASKGNQTTTRSTSKSASLDSKEHRKPSASVLSMSGSKSSPSYNPRQSKSAINKNTTQDCAGIVHHQVTRKSGKLAVAGAPDPSHTATLHSKNKTMRNNVPSGKAAATRTPSSNNTVPVLHTEESGAQSSPKQNGIGPDETAEWRSLTSKQNRLWDKVVALQRKPAPGRSHFMERMRATFPGDWPSGSPDQTRVLVDRLTRQGHDLTQHCWTKEFLNKQTPETAVQSDDKENNLTLGRLQMTVAELQNFADRVKQEWEAWDRWRPAGGCLCPTGANGLWGDGMIAALPLTITYRMEAELRELEKLRMRVVLLQQEIYLEQALSDALSPQLSSIVPGPGCPNVSMLRGVYSLLGEGGERFPAIVLDSEFD